MVTLLVAALLLLVALAAAALIWARQRGIGTWTLTYTCTRHRRGSRARGEPVDVLLCIADHFEPDWNDATTAQARARVARWVCDYPRSVAGIFDSDNRPPRHTFFYPAETYNPFHLDALAELCREGFGEVEVHLHHDADTSESLRQQLIEFAQILHERHGLLAPPREPGEPIPYAFIHGNWALDNSRPDGRWCGVNNELDVLRETGCYADFTLPSAPSPTQTRKINSIYYASDDPKRPKSHDSGRDVGRGPQPPRSLMLIQGPLVLNWRQRKFGLLPRLENANLQASQLPTASRIDDWLRANVHVAGRPDWRFVKLHTHGAQPSITDVLLGAPMRQFHESLRQRAAADASFRYHYVTAREMYNLARAAEAGWQGSVADALNYELAAPFGVRQGTQASIAPPVLAGIA